MKWISQNILTILMIIGGSLVVYYVIIPFLKGTGTGAGIGGGIAGGLLGAGAIGAAGAAAGSLLKGNNNIPQGGGNTSNLSDPLEDAGDMFEDAIEVL